MNGVLPVDKPAGPTSHDVVAAARRALDTRRIGHTGTLDPFATGLLLLCVGPSTKLAQYISGLDKVYEAVARLGTATDTLDATGEVVAETDAWASLDEAAVRAAFERQQGTVRQTPPAYSAKRVGGRKAYELARSGQAVELAPVEVTIHALEVESVDGADVHFRMRCSSGTYVRAVARDAGETLGVGAHLTALRRTAVGRHEVADAVGFDALTAAEADGSGSGTAEAVETVLLTPLQALAHLPRVEVDAEQARRVGHGQRLELAAETGLVALAEGGELRAVAESDGRFVRPRKVFA